MTTVDVFGTGEPDEPPKEEQSADEIEGAPEDQSEAPEEPETEETEDSTDGKRPERMVVEAGSNRRTVKDGPPRAFAPLETIRSR
ncbi:hypothetical protein [Halovivax gelatinilyticus]|uniref:hypothetical protein n=1 Tax=Halovivax gelatinilyticus TaxID=2961597 RepID=UPI0020CA4E75|nr:hypothetical protein [Halovivax gelatinilyticus]